MKKEELLKALDQIEQILVKRSAEFKDIRKSMNRMRNKAEVLLVQAELL